MMTFYINDGRMIRLRQQKLGGDVIVEIFGRKYPEEFLFRRVEEARKIPADQFAEMVLQGLITVPTNLPTICLQKGAENGKNSPEIQGDEGV